MLEETLGQVGKPRIYLSIQYKHDLTGQIYGKLHPKAIRYKHHLGILNNCSQTGLKGIFLAWFIGSIIYQFLNSK